MIYARFVMKVTRNWPSILKLRSTWNFLSGFGSSVIAILKKSKIKRNLYYEIKERVTEERMEGMNINRRKQKVKVYGFDETKNSRNLLMDILRVA